MTRLPDDAAAAADAPPGDAAAADRRARGFLPHLRGIARNLTARCPAEFDEAVSAGLVGLAEAVATFDPARGKFKSHAHTYVRTRIIDHLRANRPRGHGGRNCRPLAATMLPINFSAISGAGGAGGGGYGDGDGGDPADLAAGEPPVGWEIRSEDAVLALARRLPRRHGEVIRARYLHADGADLAGCATRMGLRVPRVVQLHREALAMLAGGGADDGRDEGGNGPGGLMAGRTLAEA